MSMILSQIATVGNESNIAAFRGWARFRIAYASYQSEVCTTCSYWSHLHQADDACNGRMRAVQLVLDLGGWDAHDLPPRLGKVDAVQLDIAVDDWEPEDLPPCRLCWVMGDSYE